MKRGFTYFTFFVLLCVPLVYGQCVDLTGALGSGLISRWSADSTIADSEGTNDGSIQGNVTYINHSGFGQAWHVGGTSSDYIEVPHDASLTPSELTLSIWTNHVGSSTGGNIFDKYNESAGEGYEMRDPIAGKYSWITDSDQLDSTGSKPFVGGWTHTVFTYDNTAGKRIVFFGNPNNAFNANNSYTGGITTTPVSLEIGRGLGGSAGGAYIDEVILWDRALTDSEITEVYNGGDGQVCNFVCGDGVIDPGEQCDDGNTANGDGCSSTCQWDGTGCTNIEVGSATYTLVQDVNSTFRCVDVNAPNVVLDCAGFSMTYAGAGSDSGITVNAANVTIKNCNIDGYDDAISLVNTVADNLRIQDTIIGSNTNTAVDAGGSDNDDITVINLTAGSMAEPITRGVSMTGATNLQISNSTLYAQQPIRIGSSGGSNHVYEGNYLYATDRCIEWNNVDSSVIRSNTLVTPTTGTDHGIILENGAGGNSIEDNTLINITGRGIAVVDQFFGTFYVQENRGGWDDIDSISYGIYPREETAFVSADFPGTFTLRLRHDDAEVSAAHIDSIVLVVNGSELPPSSATNLNESEGILAKVFDNDLDVADVLGDTIELTWDGMSPGEYELKMIAREEPSTATRTPLYNPVSAKNEDTYLSHTLSGGTVPIVDGMITPADNYGSPTFTIDWHPLTGHPDATNLWYLSNDNDTLYIGFEFTSDNTDDYGVDWAAAYVDVAGTKQAFKVSTNDTTYGQSSWSYTPSVAYQHKVFEFAIPLSEIGATNGDKIDISFAAYGTGGGGNPSNGNWIRDNSITSNGTGILITSSSTQNITGNTVIATSGSEAIEISFSSSLLLKDNTFSGGYDFSSAGIDGFSRTNILDYLPSSSFSCTSSNLLSEDLQLEQGFIFANGAVSCWDQQADLTFYNIQYDNPIILKDTNDDGRYEPCGSSCGAPTFSNEQFSLTVFNFSAYKIFNNGSGIPTSLEIWDPADPEGGSNTIFVGNNTLFSANYTDLNSSNVPNATLTLTIPGSLATTNMTFNASGNNLWTHTHVFNTSGNYTWIVNATNTAGYNNGTLNDTITILDAPADPGTEPIPEFSTIALFAILGLVLGGFVVMRKHQK